LTALKEILVTTTGGVNNSLTISLNYDFLMDMSVSNLSQMIHMNAKRISEESSSSLKNISDVECEQDMDKPYHLIDTVEGLQQAAIGWG
jgi:hypothetical protein